MYTAPLTHMPLNQSLQTRIMQETIAVKIATVTEYRIVFVTSLHAMSMSKACFGRMVSFVLCVLTTM